MNLTDRLKLLNSKNSIYLLFTSDGFPSGTLTLKNPKGSKALNRSSVL